jgi:3-hydroxyisobutyrate dehydrogenase-like beta-hydroxyacid dehydrogenase
MRVGFIGLGAMGLPMARHLLEAHHDVMVTSRSRGPIDKAVAAGATDGGTHDEVVRASEVTIVCNAMRTRIPFEGVLPDGPASNGWQPGFMADLMAKDLDLAIGFAARATTPLFSSGIVRQLLTAASAAGYGREDFSSLGKIVRELGRV